jgi:hypothetical protein
LGLDVPFRVYGLDGPALRRAPVALGAAEKKESVVFCPPPHWRETLSFPPQGGDLGRFGVNKV